MRIHRCRICKSKDLIPIGSLGNIAISNFTEKPEMGVKSPLELVYCATCTLLQLAHNPPRDKMYKHYWYESHLNPVIVKDLKEIAQYCRGFHIDIGANDGTLLRFSRGISKIAVDPSNIKPDGFVWKQCYWEDYRDNEFADTITAIACIYDLPNPNKFFKKIKFYLAPDGVFIAQLMTLQPMIENNDVGNICHEHIEYYSYKSLVRLYEQNGLEIFKVEKNSINGGSYRLFARHYRTGSIPFKEKEYSVTDLKNFFKRIEKNKKDFISWMEKSFPDGVIGYGASTKANTILQYYGVWPSQIVDVNLRKKGRFMIDSHCQIINKIPKDTKYLWVFPYGFLDFFKKKEKIYKGKWVTTIPYFKII